MNPIESGMPGNASGMPEFADNQEFRGHIGAGIRHSKKVLEGEKTCHELAEGTKQLLEGFLVDLERLGYGATSISQHRQAVAEFLERESHKADKQAVERHYRYLLQRPNQRRVGGLSSITVGHHLYALRLFFTYLVETGVRKDHPMSGLYVPAAKGRERIVLRRSEVKDLYEVCESELERAVLSVFYGCGLRRSEAEGLDMRDVQLRRAMLYVRSGKGGRRRVVPMSGQVVKDLAAYAYGQRNEKRKQNEQAFFINQIGTKMRGQSFYKLLKRLCKRVGLSSNIGLHHLRHSIATHLLQAGLPVEQVRDFLGHKALESTQIYTHIDIAAIGSEHEKL